MTGRVRSGSLKILLAEDDPVTAELVVHGLARDPALSVLHVTDGGTALSVIQRERLAAAILDIRLPVLDGLYLLLTIREDPRHEHLPVVMLTSLGAEADVIRGFELGADDYVVKPFSANELAVRLQRLLGRRPARSSRTVAAPPPAPPPPPVDAAGEAAAPRPKRNTVDPELPPFDFDD